jgi:hypothetical protein
MHGFTNFSGCMGRPNTLLNSLFIFQYLKNLWPTHSQDFLYIYVQFHLLFPTKDERTNHKLYFFEIWHFPAYTLAYSATLHFFFCLEQPLRNRLQISILQSAPKPYLLLKLQWIMPLPRSIAWGPLCFVSISTIALSMHVFSPLSLVPMIIQTHYSMMFYIKTNMQIKACMHVEISWFMICFSQSSYNY